jgi:hypothetical protein
MRSRLAFAHLGPAPNSHGLGIGGSALSTSRDGRRLSQASATSSGASEGMHRQRSAGAAPSGSNGSAYGAESSSSLDFSARRNSKGSIGDFGGGLRMTRGYSDDEVLGGKRWSGSGGSGGRRGSGDSLASQMHDADERSERGYSASESTFPSWTRAPSDGTYPSDRPPSALSAFRLMTPISDHPPSPRRPSISQHHTTSYQGDMRSPHMPTERSVSAGEIRKLAATGETIVPEKAWKGHRNDGPVRTLSLLHRVLVLTVRGSRCYRQKSPSSLASPVEPTARPPSPSWVPPSASPTVDRWTPNGRSRRNHIARRRLPPYPVSSPKERSSPRPPSPPPSPLPPYLQPSTRPITDHHRPRPEPSSARRPSLVSAIRQEVTPRRATRASHRRTTRHTRNDRLRAPLTFQKVVSMAHITRDRRYRPRGGRRGSRRGLRPSSRGGPVEARVSIREGRGGAR